MSRTPTTLGLLLCEQVVVEEGTRNVTLVNCFTRRQLSGDAPESLSFVIFTLLTNGQGTTPVEVAVHRMDDFEEVYRRDSSLNFAKPTQVVRCVVRVRDCPFPGPGVYQISLSTGDHILGQRLLTLFTTEANS